MTNWAETLRKGVFWECESYKINIKGVKEVGGSQSPNCMKKICRILGTLKRQHYEGLPFMSWHTLLTDKKESYVILVSRLEFRSLSYEDWKLKWKKTLAAGM